MPTKQRSPSHPLPKPYHIPLSENIIGKYNATKVVISNARNGVGIKANNTIRSILDVLVIKNATAKIIVSGTPHNVVRATFIALKTLTSIALKTLTSYTQL